MASPAAAKPEVFPLAGGGTLIVAPETGTGLVAIDIFFRVGVAEENEANAGITALLTRAWTTAAAGRAEPLLGLDITGLGGNVGTVFGGDYVELFTVTAATPDALDLAMQTLFINIIARPLFAESDLADARQEQLRERQLEDDQIFADTLSGLRKRVWAFSPYARSLLGTPDTIRSLTPEKVREYYRRHFTLDRAVIVVAGDVQPDRVKEQIEVNIGASGWRDRGKSPPLKPIAPESLGQTSARVDVNRRARATVTMAGFVAPGTQAAGDYPALLLLETLVGSGKSSRLFRSLRDSQGIGYQVGTLLQPQRYQSLLTGYVVADTFRPGPTGMQPQINEVSQALVREMRSVITRAPDDEEIARAKALLKGRYALRKQRLKDRAYALGWAEVMGLGSAFDTEFDARIDAVTPADLQRLAARILGANYVLAITLPEP